MGLSTALARLHADRALEGVVRDILLLFRQHPGQHLSAAEVAARTARPLSLVEPVLLTLKDAFVLDFQPGASTYRYLPEPLLEMDMERYLRRVNVLNDRLQNNVARFRQRFEHF